MEVQFWATTDTGRVRDHNEDNFLVDSDLNLFVVCDGMGGHAAGEVASALTLRTVHEVVGQGRELIEKLEREPGKREHRQALLALLERAISEACERVFAAGQRDATRSGMGTTCSALMVLAGRGFIGHVGDSRIYRLRNGQVDQLTDDHSLLNEMIRQGRAKAGDSIPNQNAVTRAVGVRESVEVDTHEFELTAGDSFLLCSDGFSGYVEDDAQLRSLLDDDDLEACAEACVRHALDAGGKDNITTILVDVVSTDTSHQTRLDSRVVETLADSSIFAHATPAQLAQLASVAERHGFEAGATIIERSTSAASLCLIVKGSVGVVGPEAGVTVLGAGESFGAVSLFSGPGAGEAFEALEPTNLLVFRRQPLFALLRRQPELAAKVLFGLASTFAEQLQRVPAELRFEPQRWDEVRIEADDDTPAPGFLVVDDRGDQTSERPPDSFSQTSPFGGETSPANEPPSDEEFDPEDLRTTIKLDLNDDGVEEL